ncbi:MAG: STAS domain-containing protein [Acidobacteriaceae bacterium]
MRDESFTYTSRDGTQGNTIIMELAGPLTLTNLFAFQHELTMTHPETLILDLSGVPYMDSAGLGVLMNCYVSADKHGRKFALAGVSERILALLELTRVNTLLKIFATVEQAEANL